MGVPGVHAFDFVDSNSATLSGDIGAKTASLVFGLFLGVMLTASAYLFFIWVVMRDRGQVFLLCLLLCLCLYIASTNDLLMLQLGFQTPNMRALLTSYSLILSCLFSLSFTYYFLEVDVHAPQFRTPLVVFGLALSILLAYSLFDQSLVHFILPMLSALTVMVVMSTGVACLHAGVSGSFTHIIAFTFFLAGTLADPLHELGLISNASSSYNFTYVSFSMAALMFAIVIASQFAARQEEKERALATSNERFTLATRGANEGLFDWDMQSGEVFFSDQFRKIIGLRLENNVRSLKLWMRMVLPADRRIVREALRRFRHSPDANTINIEYRVISANRERRWLHSKVVAVRRPGTRRVMRLVGSTSDITARKQSEVALRASEARFRSITEAHPVPVMIISLRSNAVLYASPGAEQLFDLHNGAILNYYFDQFIVSTDTREQLWRAMMSGQAVNMMEVRLERSTGMPIDAALSARRINYQSEDAMVIGFYDLTERKRAEAQISRQQEALQQSEKMAALGGLLAGVAHELNNPLSVIVGQATLLSEDTQEPKITSRAEKIFKAADRCTRIVKSFLALARRKPPEHKAIDVNGIINSGLELLGYQMKTGNIQTTMTLAEHLPAIIGDSDQLTQVITNLVLNAAQAMEGWSGRREIKISTCIENGMVVIRVSDTGPGIPPDIRSRVFEPFFTTKSGKGGTGVGLSLCLNIVSAHGGQMQLEDTPGGGATFVMQLPIPAGHATAVAAGAEQDVVLPHGLRLLLVDDEIEIAQTLADLLEPEGHHVDIAVNGSIALDKLRKDTYDVIISDLRMPVLDGPGMYEVLRQELPRYVNRIIYVTGDTLSTHVQSFLAQYPVPLVEKPYRLNDVRQMIAQILQKNAEEGQA
ncbi:MAG: PAS domain S-box protein [Alphaproteobacteria bacterium]|nr:PAS domain S-box protein [Alphaproteobacteria bacterium]